MKKLSLLFLTLIFFINCKNQEDNSTQNNLDTKTISENQDCVPYFDFDQVEYYSINIEENKVYNLYDIEDKTENETKLLSILEDDTFSSISDSTFIYDLEGIGYVKTKISDSDYFSLNQIFCFREHKDGEYAACIPIYRDILIFKNLNKITGMAKICFDCGQYHIVGSKEITKDFGQSGDFGKLNTLLNKYRNK